MPLVSISYKQFIFPIIKGVGLSSSFLIFNEIIKIITKIIIIIPPIIDGINIDLVYDV